MMAIDILIGVFALAALTLGVGIGAVIGAGTGATSEDIVFVIKDNVRGEYYGELQSKSTGEVLFRSAYLRHKTVDQLKADAWKVLGHKHYTVDYDGVKKLAIEWKA